MNDYNTIISDYIKKYGSPPIALNKNTNNKMNIKVALNEVLMLEIKALYNLKVYEANIYEQSSNKKYKVFYNDKEWLDKIQEILICHQISLPPIMLV